MTVFKAQMPCLQIADCPSRLEASVVSMHLHVYFSHSSLQLHTRRLCLCEIEE
jgi:hypothetical protein